jgi:hypothetical protein
VPAFSKLTIEADPALVRGFVRGWCTARGMTPEETELRVLWPQDWDVRVASVLEGIGEALKPGDVCYVLVDDDLVTPLVQALQPWSESMRVRSQRCIQGASFDFQYEIFERDEAEEVRRIFASLPQGVQVSGTYAHEVHRGDGEGMRARAHAYAARGKGTLSGPLREVLEVHERCRQHERIRIHAVNLHLEPDAAAG